MSQATQTVEPQLRNELGHLALKVEGLRPPDLQFSFEREPKRMSGALASSIGVHAAAGLFVILFTLYGPSPDFSNPPEAADRLSKDIVWLNVPGPGGGGGGGGNQQKDPPRKIEMPGKDKITVPVAKTPDITPQPPKLEPPKLEQSLTIPAMTMAVGQQVLPGALVGVPVTDSLGSGSGGGAGTGQGTGIGPGRGSGLGPGEGGGTGGGVYRPGNGIDLPRVLREVRPNYTADAMRAKVQGTVLIEAVVLPDGTVGQVQVVRSLDTVFGLDQEAIKAAKQWRFAPGTRMGSPVAVLVTIELTFTLR
jgi:TonB family protein